MKCNTPGRCRSLIILLRRNKMDDKQIKKNLFWEFHFVMQKTPTRISIFNHFPFRIVTVYCRKPLPAPHLSLNPLENFTGKVGPKANI